jgi:glycosyltransferase involved in cell wall biosynthesis
MTRHKLTIGIPTYNRNDRLNHTLDLLLPQIDPDVIIVIYDNCSDIPVLESASTRIQAYGKIGCEISIIRNPFNIGGNANILTVLSLQKTKWLWILGDDNEPSANAIETIRREISMANDDTVLLKFSNVDPSRYRPITTETYQSIEDLIECVRVHGHSWHDNLMFISTSVFQTRLIANHLAKAFHYTYTCVPHVIIALLSVKDGHTIRYLNSTLLEFDPKTNDSINPELVDYTIVRIGLCAMGEVDGIREISEVYVPILAKHALKNAMRHSVIGIAYDYTNWRFWANASIRIGTTAGGIHGLFYVLNGILLIALGKLPPLHRLLRNLILRLNLNPQWKFNRW